MNLVCIQCPLGCHLTVEEKDGEIIVTGNNCPRGAAYGKSEMTAPVRILTTTVAIDSADHHRLPVISSAPLPKGRIMDAVKALKETEVKVPVHRGDVIVKDILGLGVDILASRSIL